MRILLHTCCAPCLVKVGEGLRAEGHQVDCYFYNPNIHPYSEHNARLKALEAYARDIGMRLITSDRYDMEDFLRVVAPRPSERCRHCYGMRLGQTARIAAERGYDAFTTTLTVSPYQDHALLSEVGGAAGDKAGVGFLYRDFRGEFRAGQREARAAGLYMQKYCGCVYSEAERYQRRNTTATSG